MRAENEKFETFFSNMKKKGDDYSKIQKLLKSNDFFLGVREDYLSIYYMGMSIATVKALARGGCSYTLSYYYLKGVKDKNGLKIYDDKTKGYFALPSEVFWNETNLETIKYNVRKHVFGFGSRGYLYLEKVCQQWIISNNNSNPESDWYFVDMEYIYKAKGEKTDHPFGRADLIAIKKAPQNGVYDVAFVELKVGTGAYTISIHVPDKITDKQERIAFRQDVIDRLKNNLWDEKIKGAKLGSGLASHVVDFMHFFAEDGTREQLRKEIIGILEVQRAFGLISDSTGIFTLNDETKIKLCPDIYIITYSDVPDIGNYELSDKAKNRYLPSLEEMKNEFFKYFYDEAGSSLLAIEKLIKNDQISGLIDLKEQYRAFMKKNEQQIECKQNINGSDYRFVFRFIDVTDKNVDCKKCIDS